MATRTSSQSGNWSDTATWGGAAAPTSADDAVIAKNHIVTLDGVCAANSVYLNKGTTGADVGGRLYASTTVNTTLTTQLGITLQGAEWGPASYVPYINLDVSAVPSINCTIRLNAVNSSSTQGLYCAGNYNLRGAHKTRWSRIASALTANSTLSVVILDATGWRVGDQLAFASTSAVSIPPKTDLVTIATLTPGSGTTATITWTDGVGTSGAVLYNHAANCPVGNFTSNLTITPDTPYGKCFTHFGGDSGSGVTTFGDSITNVSFWKMAGEYAWLRYACVLINGYNDNLVSVSHNAFFQYNQVGVFIRGTTKAFQRDYNTFYSEYISSIMDGQDFGNVDIGNDSYGCVIRASGTDGIGIYCMINYRKMIGWSVSGYVGTALHGYIESAAFELSSDMESCDIFSSSIAVRPGKNKIINCRFGEKAFPLASNYADIFPIRGEGGEYIDCELPSSLVLQKVPMPGYQSMRVKITNRDKDPAIHQIYGATSATIPIIQRTTALASRSNSSMLITMTGTAAISESFYVLAKAGETILLKVLVRKSSTYGAATLPSVTVSGLGITPVSAAMDSGTAADTWETLTLSATNSASSDGQLTVTFTAQSSTSGAEAWFAGIAAPPWITRARHYGYVFAETIPVLSANPVLSVTEITAAAYTGVTITGSQITVASGTANTWAKVYAYSQAYYCLNIASDVLLTTTDGNNFSIPLSTKLSWPAMGTDGTLVGGWILLVAGTHTYKLSGTKIDCTNAGDYNFASTQFSGTVELVNSSGGAVTVSLPSGTSYTNTGPSITVSVASTTTTIAANVSLVGAEVRIYDMDNSPVGSLGTELFGTESCPTSTFDFVTAAGNTVWVQIMLTGYKEFGQSMVTPSASTTYTFTLRAEVNA